MTEPSGLESRRKLKRTHTAMHFHEEILSDNPFGSPGALVPVLNITDDESYHKTLHIGRLRSHSKLKRDASDMKPECAVCELRRESEGHAGRARAKAPGSPAGTRPTCKLTGNTGVWGRNKNGRAQQQP